MSRPARADIAELRSLIGEVRKTFGRVLKKQGMTLNLSSKVTSVRYFFFNCRSQINLQV